jgi:hypothetical protein
MCRKKWPPSKELSVECKMHKKKSWHVLKKYEKEQRQKSLIFQTAATL